MYAFCVTCSNWSYSHGPPSSRPSPTTFRRLAIPRRVDWGGLATRAQTGCNYKRVAGEVGSSGARRRRVAEAAASISINCRRCRSARDRRPPGVSQSCSRACRNNIVCRLGYLLSDLCGPENQPRYLVASLSPETALRNDLDAEASTSSTGSSASAIFSVLEMTSSHRVEKRLVWSSEPTVVILTAAVIWRCRPGNQLSDVFRRRNNIVRSRRPA